MKRLLCAILGLLLTAGLAAGCGSVELDADESVVYVDKKGAVTYLDVETFDQSIYDEEGLRSFLEEEIEAYTQEHGKNAVKLESLAVENGIARLWITCQSAEDFAQYNGIELYQGRVVDALSAGYVFDGEFVKVEDGAVAGASSKQEIYRENDLKVVIIRANLDVRVEGEICYVSCQNVSLTGSDGVSIRPGYYLGQTQAASNTGAGVQADAAVAQEDVTEDTEKSGADGGSGAQSGSGADAPDQDGTERGDEDSGDRTESGDTEEGSAQTEQDEAGAGLVIDADTSGGTYRAGAAVNPAGEEVYTFIVYR